MSLARAAYAAGLCSMQMLRPDEIEELREHIANLQLPVDRLDVLISLLDSIAISFVSQAFGESTTQLSLSARANRAFAASENRGKLEASKNIGFIDLDNEGALNIKGPVRRIAP